MNKINCEVIEDLLPIYVEDMASLSSRAIVEEHLTACEQCAELEKSMRKSVQLPKDIDTKVLKKISGRIFQKKFTAVVLAILCMSLLALLMVVHLNSPITISYEEISDTIKVEVTDDGIVSIVVASPGGNIELENGVDEDGVFVKYIRCYTTRWNMLTGKKTSMDVFWIGNSEFAGEQTAKRVYYYPSIKTGEAVCLYEAEEVKDNTSGGVVVLPRLTLNYYTFLAVVLTLIGLICCFIVGKDARKLHVILKITLFPAVYALSSIIVLCGKGKIYDAEYYFTGILIIAMVAYIIGFWVLDYLRYHGKLKLNNK